MPRELKHCTSTRYADLVFRRRERSSGVESLDLRKVERWKDELVNGSFTVGALGRILPRNLAGILRDPHNCIVTWEPWATHARMTDSQRGNVKKKKSTRSSHPGRITGFSRVSRAALSPIHLQRSVAPWDSPIDGIAFSRTRTVRCAATAPKLGHSGAKQGEPTSYSLLIPIPADFSHDPGVASSLNEKKSRYCAVKFISQIRFPPAVAPAKLDRPYN